MKSLRSTLKYFFAAGFLFVMLTNCSKDNGAAPDSSTDIGNAGSLARFAFRGNNMYVVNSSKLKTYDVSNPTDPKLLSELSVGQSVETIFPLDDKLFIGTQGGMFIYTITATGVPQYVSQYDHVTSCDPVVANGQFAFVTLNSGNLCRQWSDLNQLDVVSLQNIEHPSLVQSYQLESPLGLGLDGNTLFVCEESFGLKVFNVGDPTNIQQIYNISGIDAKDVILLEGHKLLILTPDSIIQYDYSDMNNIKKVSEMPIQA